MKVTYYYSNASTLDQVPFIQGNMIFVQNERKIYIDGTQGRIPYDGMLYFETEEERVRKRNPLPGFYFVKDERKLWYYADAEWTCLSGGDGGEEQEKQIEFSTYDELPAMGEENKLYVDKAGKSLYIWDDSEEDYVQMAGSGEADWIEV